MKSHTLFTYRNLDELREIQNEREVFVFEFGGTKDILDNSPNVCIDITALIYFLQLNKNNIQPVYVNFSEMSEDTIVIIESSLAQVAIELLPFLFCKHVNYFEKEEPNEDELPKYKPYSRQKIYKYNSSKDLEKIIKYAEEKNIPIATFSRANGDLRKEFEDFNKNTPLALLDLTSVSCAIEDNKTVIYAIEQFLSAMPNIKVIAKTTQVDIILKYFPLFFDGQDNVNAIIPDILGTEENEPEENNIIKIPSLSWDSFNDFILDFNHNLIGHKYFKKRFEHALKNFIILNRAKEQKIFSVFLFGASGIGKTEVARLIANGLKDNSYLAKINFQNYSSQDALNSLIGSPAGYIGCDHGELSDKVQKSKVGVLLCDEFEKTTRPVFSFFLELLEEGRFTDSMAREYDMDGYIIVFTSNIPNESEYKKIIPQELQTRFDLVCEFEEPTKAEKMEFLELLLEKALQKYSEQFAAFTLTEEDKQSLFGFDYSSLSALRDIKRVFNNRLIDLFNAKGLF